MSHLSGRNSYTQFNNKSSEIQSALANNATNVLFCALMFGLLATNPSDLSATCVDSTMLYGLYLGLESTRSKPCDKRLEPAN